MTTLAEVDDEQLSEPAVTDRPRSRVQSIERVFGLLELISVAGGAMGLADLARVSGLAPATIHRLMQTVVELGYARQLHSRQYALGPRLAGLADSAQAVLGMSALPLLRQLAAELGESANLAALDGREVIYVAHAPGTHSMRIFTEAGKRAAAHSTAAGKAILAGLDDGVVDALFEAEGLTAQTANSITTPSLLKRELLVVRNRGYALDEQEQEIGVRCVAVAVPNSKSRTAISISGPVTRMTQELVESAFPKLMAAAARLAAELDTPRLLGPEGRRHTAIVAGAVRSSALMSDRRRSAPRRTVPPE